MKERSYVVIRGPLATGKTKLGLALRDSLNQSGIPASYLSLDLIKSMTGNRLPTKENKRLALQSAVPIANVHLENGRVPIIEGVLYEQEFMEYIFQGVDGQAYIFRIDASEDIRLARNKQRGERGSNDEKVIASPSWFKRPLEGEIIIPNEKSLDDAVNNILKHLEI